MVRAVYKLEANQRKEEENSQVRKLEGMIHKRAREVSRHIHHLGKQGREAQIQWVSIRS